MIDGICHECEIECLKYELQEYKETQALANLRYMVKCKELDLLRQSLPKIKADAVRLATKELTHFEQIIYPTLDADDLYEYANKLEAGE